MAQQEYRYVEPVRGLGTTWYERGFAYWLRRIGLSLLFLFLAAGGGALSFLLLRTFWTNRTIPTGVRWGATVVAVVTVGWSAVATVRSANRDRAVDTKRRDRKTRRGILAVSTGLIGLLRLTAVGLVMLALCFFITFGSMSVLFAYSLRREYFAEHQARLRDQLRHHQGPERKRARAPKPHTAG